MMEPLSAISLAVRMVVVMFFAAMAWNLYERRYYGMATLFLGMFLSMFRTILLRVLAIHRYDYANDAESIRQIGLWLQSPQVTLWPELVMLAGLVLVAKRFGMFFNNRGGKYGRQQ